MIYVGIDIAKRAHVACAIDDENRMLLSPFRFRESQEGYKELVGRLEELSDEKGEFLIAMEATGLLFENLYRHLHSLGYRVVLLNPYQVAKFRELETMKRQKSDNIDAKMIAALLKSGRFAQGYVSQEELQSLRTLYRHRKALEDQLKATKRRLKTLLGVVFPEIEEVIKDPLSVTGLALLEKYPTAKHYEYANVERILKTFRGIKGNNMDATKAKQLLTLAKRSVYSGSAKEARALAIRSNITMIRTLQHEIEKIDETIASLFNAPLPSKEEEEEIVSLIDNLRTIPGVGDRTILTLLAECGDLKRFHNAKALVGYLGLYPTFEHSGSIKRSGKLAKRGARLAKKMIYLAAIAAIRHNEQLRQIYQNHRSKGRAKKEAIIIVARRLLAIIYAIYKYNVPYDPNRVFVARPNIQCH